MRNYVCYNNFPIFSSFTQFSRISLLSCLFVPPASFILLRHSLLHTNNLKVFNTKEFISSVFLSEAFHDLHCLTLEVETDKLYLEEFTDRLSRKVRNQLLTYDA